MPRNDPVSPSTSTGLSSRSNFAAPCIPVLRRLSCMTRRAKHLQVFVVVRAAILVQRGNVIQLEAVRVCNKGRGTWRNADQPTICATVRPVASCPPAFRLSCRRPCSPQ